MALTYTAQTNVTGSWNFKDPVREYNYEHCTIKCADDLARLLLHHILVIIIIIIIIIINKQCILCTSQNKSRMIYIYI